MNRARIREIANSVAHSDAMLTDYAGIEKAIESALLRFAEELLTQEPSWGVLEAGVVEVRRAETSSLTTHAQEATQIYKAMSAQLLKEVNGE